MKRLAEESIERSTRALLRLEASMLLQIGRQLAPNIRNLLPLGQPHAAKERADQYWEGRSPLPGALGYLGGVVESDPIGYSLSLYIPGSSPTIYALVPYGVSAHQGESESESDWWTCQWLLSEPPLSLDESAMRSSLRMTSHALLNISFSARVDDRPTLGFISYAHKIGKPLYIRDVQELPANPEVRSISRNEEPCLGMASVLYVPLRCSIGLEGGSNVGPQALAVLMLWSPIPDRWRGLRAHKVRHPKGCKEIEDEALGGIAEDRELCALADQARDTMAAIQATSVSEMLGLLNGIRIRVKHKDQRVRELVNHLLHGFISSLDRFEEVGEGGLYAGRAFYEDWFRGYHISALLTSKRWPYPPLMYGNESRYHEAGARKARYPSTDWLDEFTIAIPEDVVDNVRNELFGNLQRYAGKFTEIEISTTSHYLCVSFSFLPASQATDFTTPAGFESYYRQRRGLVTVSSGGGGGYGSALQTALLMRTQSYYRLIVHPDGSNLRVELALKLHRGGD